MNILLDTHILIWALENNQKLSKKGRNLIIDPDNLIFVSSVSIWEITIKSSLGKLNVPDNLLEEIKLHRFSELPISHHHARAVADLPDLHKDPFDRMLIAQANHEKMSLMTVDENIKLYSVNIAEM